VLTATHTQKQSHLGTVLALEKKILAEHMLDVTLPGLQTNFWSLLTLRTQSTHLSDRLRGPIPSSGGKTLLDPPWPPASLVSAASYPEASPRSSPAKLRPLCPLPGAGGCPPVPRPPWPPRMGAASLGKPRGARQPRLPALPVMVNDNDVDGQKPKTIECELGRQICFHAELPPAFPH